MKRKLVLAKISTAHPVLHPRRVDGYIEALAIRMNRTSPGTSTFHGRARPQKLKGPPQKEKWHLVFPTWLNNLLLQATCKTEPEKRITEEAALAIALATLDHASGLRVREVTISGDRGDYWIEDQQGQLVGLLEVSGSIARTRRAAAIYRAKRRQVLRNKQAKIAVTCVSHFGDRRGYYCRVR